MSMATGKIQHQNEQHKKVINYGLMIIFSTDRQLSMIKDYAKLTGSDVMRYRKSITRAEFKNALFCTMILLTFGVALYAHRQMQKSSLSKKI